MTANEPAGGTGRPRLQRSQQNRIVGGVCAGIAEHLGIDSLLVRIVAVLLAIASAGGAVVAYLVAWVLIPQAGEPRAAPGQPPTPHAADKDVRQAWRSVGEDLRTLAAGLRPNEPAPAGEQDAPAPGHGTRSPVDAVDAALTALGQRLRDPEVHADARRAAADISAAVSASVDEVGRRARRGGESSARESVVSDTDERPGRG